MDLFQLVVKQIEEFIFKGTINEPVRFYGMAFSKFNEHNINPFFPESPLVIPILSTQLLCVYSLSEKDHLIPLNLSDTIRFT